MLRSEMPRRFRALSLGVALVLATLVTATPATAAAAAAPPLPDSIAAIGDSITQAVDVCCLFGSWPGNSWSTGYVPLDGIASHYERIRAQNPRIRGHRWNNAVSGARMAHAPGQARATVRQGAEYVTILMGANDLCGWNGTLTPTATFRTHPLAQAVWQAAGICPSMLNFFNSPADRQAVSKRQRELNNVLRDVCATWSRCRFDDYVTYNYDFTRGLVSKLDWFHPSLSGQATLATLTWNASWWG